MPKVTVHLAPPAMLGIRFLDKKVIPLVREHLPFYKNGCSFNTHWEGELAAEEAFDLSNNPARQFDRDEKYGMCRSVSSGDVIEVGQEKFLCLSMGWAKL
jgi:hypothetical protein